jgi:hypothetical protein
VIHLNFFAMPVGMCRGFEGEMRCGILCSGNDDVLMDCGEILKA